MFPYSHRFHSFTHGQFSTLNHLYIQVLTYHISSIDIWHIYRHHTHVYVPNTHLHSSCPCLHLYPCTHISCTCISSRPRIIPFIHVPTSHEHVSLRTHVKMYPLYGAISEGSFSMWHHFTLSPENCPVTGKSWNGHMGVEHLWCLETQEEVDIFEGTEHCWALGSLGVRSMWSLWKGGSSARRMQNPIQLGCRWEGIMQGAWYWGQGRFWGQWQSHWWPRGSRAVSCLELAVALEELGPGKDLLEKDGQWGNHPNSGDLLDYGDTNTVSQPVLGPWGHTWHLLSGALRKPSIFIDTGKERNICVSGSAFGQ